MTSSGICYIVIGHTKAPLRRSYCGIIGGFSITVTAVAHASVVWDGEVWAWLKIVVANLYSHLDLLLFSYCVEIVKLSLAFGLCVEGLTPITFMSILNTERSKAPPI